MVLLLLQKKKKKKKDRHCVEIALLLIVMLKIKHLRQHLRYIYFFHPPSYYSDCIYCRVSCRLPVFKLVHRCSVLDQLHTVPHPSPTPRVLPSQALYPPPCVCLSLCVVHEECLVTWCCFKACCPAAGKKKVVFFFISGESAVA